MLLVPDYHVHLLSVHKLARYSRVGVYFNESNVYLQDLQTTQIVRTGSQSGGLYFLDKDSVSTSSLDVSPVVSFISTFTWHNRLGHPADKVLNILKGSLGYSFESPLPCEVCHRAKQTRESFSLSNRKAVCLGELIHLDVWGPYRVPTREGFRFFLMVVDDFSRAVWIFLLKGKDDVYDNIVVFSNMLKNQFSKNIKVARSV